MTGFDHCITNEVNTTVFLDCINYRKLSKVILTPVILFGLVPF